MVTRVTIPFYVPTSNVGEFHLLHILIAFWVFLGVFLFFKYLFIYFWLHWVFVAECGLPLVVASGGYSSLWCAGFSLQWLLLLRSMGSRCAASVVVAGGLSSCGSRALEHRLSSCGAQAQLLCGMWDLPWPGLEPVSPALAGRFLTTVPPGKSQDMKIFNPQFPEPIWGISQLLCNINSNKTFC